MEETECRFAPYHDPLGQICILILAVAAISLTWTQPPIFAATALPRFIDEYAVPTPNAAPLALTVDKDGIVWFTESNVTKLGRFDPRNYTFQEYSVPGIGDMWGITTDPSGNIWLTQYSLKGSVNPGGAIEPGGTGRLIRFNPNDGNFTVINVRSTGAFPFRITSDNRGRVWFTELLGNQIGYYDPSSGALQEFPVPTQFAGPADLTFDNHGTLWFSEAYNGSVGSFDLQTKSFVEYHFSKIDPTQYVGSPVGISIAPDGTIWVADHGGNWLVEFNGTSQQIARYPTHEPPPQVYPISIPNDLLIDHQGRIWFAEHGGNSIGFLDPQTKRMVEFAIPTGPISTALWIALAPDNDVWFTEWSANKIGVVHTNITVPIMITPSATDLSLQAGGETSLSLEVNGSQGIAGQGTYVYSWPTYNPTEVNVTFSPPNESLTASSTGLTQVRIVVSPSASLGGYLLGLGLDLGSLRVWTFVQTEVSAGASASFLGSTNLPYLIGGTLAALALIVMVQRRFRGTKGKRDRRPEDADLNVNLMRIR